MLSKNILQLDILLLARCLLIHNVADQGAVKNLIGQIGVLKRGMCPDAYSVFLFTPDAQRLNLVLQNGILVAQTFNFYGLSVGGERF